MLHNRTIYPSILSCLLLLSSCSSPEADIPKHLEAGEYEVVYTYVGEQIENRTATVRKYLNDEPEPFETALLGLLASDSEYASKTSKLLSNKYRHIKNHERLERRIWGRLINQNRSVPDSLHSFLLHQFETDNIQHKTHIYEQFSSDYGFKAIVLNYYEEYLEGNLSIPKSELESLTQLVELQELSQVVVELNSVKKQLWDTRHDYKYIETRVENAFSFAEDHRKEYEEVKEIIDESYIFSGYMVAYMSDNFRGDYSNKVYSAKNMTNSKPVMLVTTDTRFTTMGHFRLRVVELGEIPYKWKDENGNESQDKFTAVMELPASRIEDYKLAKFNYEVSLADANEAEATKEERKATLNSQIRSQQAKAKELKAQLTTLINKHSKP